MTLCYRIRLTSITFFFKGISQKFSQVSEDFVMYSPMFLLYLMRVAGGSLFTWSYFPGLFVLIPLIVKIFLIIGLLLLFALFSVIKVSSPYMWGNSTFFLALM
jgi:hypothetical protein